MASSEVDFPALVFVVVTLETEDVEDGLAVVEMVSVVNALVVAAALVVFETLDVE